MPPGLGSSGGSCSAHRGCARGQRVLKRQPEGGRCRARHVALQHLALPRALPVSDPTAAPLTEAPGCRDGSASRRARRARPPQRSSPDTITATRSQRWCTTDRSWAMNRYERPKRSWRSFSRLSTPAWIETSSAEDRLVEDDQVGAQRQRARDADTLALAAGEFMRVAIRMGGIELHQAEQFRHIGRASAPHSCRSAAAVRQ